MTRLDARGEPSMEDILASIRKIIAEDPPSVRPPSPLTAAVTHTGRAEDILGTARRAAPEPKPAPAQLRRAIEPAARSESPEAAPVMPESAAPAADVVGRGHSIAEQLADVATSPEPDFDGVDASTERDSEAESAQAQDQDQDQVDAAADAHQAEEAPVVEAAAHEPVAAHDDDELAEPVAHADVDAQLTDILDEPEPPSSQASSAPKPARPGFTVTRHGYVPDAMNGAAPSAEPADSAKAPVVADGEDDTDPFAFDLGPSPFAQRAAARASMEQTVAPAPSPTPDAANSGGDDSSDEAKADEAFLSAAAPAETDHAGADAVHDADPDVADPSQWSGDTDSDDDVDAVASSIRDTVRSVDHNSTARASVTDAASQRDEPAPSHRRDSLRSEPLPTRAATMPNFSAPGSESAGRYDAGAGRMASHAMSSRHANGMSGDLDTDFEPVVHRSTRDVLDVALPVAPRASGSQNAGASAIEPDVVTDHLHHRGYGNASADDAADSHDDVDTAEADVMTDAMATAMPDDAASEQDFADDDNRETGKALTVSDPDQRAMEDTVADLLRPMLKSWLAENMPKIVERALRREISELGLSSRKSTSE